MFRPRTAAVCAVLAAGLGGVALFLVPARLTAQQPATPASWAGSYTAAKLAGRGFWLGSQKIFIDLSGYLVFVTDHKVWPKGIEIQGNNMNMLHSFGMDAKVVATDYPDARTRVYRPVGEWNSVETVSKDGQIKSYLNRELMSHVTEHEFKEAGYIGFQSEGVPLQWRNIRIKADQG